MMALMIGLIQTGITLLRLGDFSRFISHAVIVGFTAGASALLVMDQFKNLVGWPQQGNAHDHFLKRFYLTVTAGEPIHWQTLWVALGTIATILILRAMNRRFRLGLPEFLLGIVLAGLGVWLLSWSGPGGVKLVESIPRQLPSFSVPTVDLALASDLAGGATAIAFLGLLEAIAMAKSLAARSGQRLDVNQQCLSEGLANLVGSFFQCFPGSGSLTRSFINHQAGAATQWSGVISAAMVALTVLVLAPLAVYLPKPALAGVLVLTACRMIDYRGLAYHMRATRFDAIIVIATAFVGGFYFDRVLCLDRRGVVVLYVCPAGCQALRQRVDRGRESCGSRDPRRGPAMQSVPYLQFRRRAVLRLFDRSRERLRKNYRRTDTRDSGYTFSAQASPQSRRGVLEDLREFY